MLLGLGLVANAITASAHGARLSSTWVAVQTDAGKVESVTLEWFRDSGTTAASRAGVSLGAVKVWLGHSRNHVDSYGSVEPLHTQPVVDAICAEYFAGENAG